MPGLLKTNAKEDDDDQGHQQELEDNPQRDHYNELRQMLQDIRADRANNGNNYRLIEPRFLRLMRDDPALLVLARQRIMREHMHLRQQQQRYLNRGQQAQQQQQHANNSANIEANNAAAAAAANDGSNNSGNNAGNM